MTMTISLTKWSSDDHHSFLFGFELNFSFIIAPNHSTAMIVRSSNSAEVEWTTAGRDRPRASQFDRSIDSTLFRSSLLMNRATGDDYRRQKELDEARKAGLAPAALDEDGKEINPHIPEYMTSAPWYLQKDK